MILGTVELGLDYGINNENGKPSREQAFELLDTAWNLGIRELDTAVAYGDAEEIIGLYQEKSGHKFLIDTKLPVMSATAVNSIASVKATTIKNNIDNENNEDYDMCLTNACKRLKLDSLNLLYLHSFEQCKNERILSFLKKQKDTGKVKYIGISIYEPNEMEYIVKYLPCVNVIQFPFNLLDNYRWEDSMREAHVAGKLLYARSIFLQGLIFKSPADSFIESIGASRFIARIIEIAKETDVSIAELACQFVQQIPEINDIIIGCQTVHDVRMNAGMMLTTEMGNAGRSINKTTIRQISKLSENVPEHIIDPRKWKKL